MDAIIYKDTIYSGGGAMRGNYFNPIIYSAEEREVGVWKDNKPLYQKTFTQQLSGNSGQINIDSYNMETAFIVDGYYDIGATKISLNEYLNSSTYSWTHINTGTNPRVIDCYNTVSSNSTINITVAYTKTTDTAGSGKYNTLGVPNVHYTTDEQVIGTWIDGKPLYRKTYEVTAQSAWTQGVNVVATIDTDCIIKKMNCSVVESGYYFDMPYVAANNSSIKLYIHNGDIVFEVNNTSYAAGSVATIILEYTKTTD